MRGQLGEVCAVQGADVFGLDVGYAVVGLEGAFDDEGGGDELEYPNKPTWQNEGLKTSPLPTFLRQAGQASVGFIRSRNSPVG
jgi:hypothetical protein